MSLFKQHGGTHKNQKVKGIITSGGQPKNAPKKPKLPELGKFAGIDFGKHDHTSVKLVSIDEHNKIHGMETPGFLVVYEDLQKVRHSYQTRKVGKTIQDIVDNHELIIDLSKTDLMRMNKDPYSSTQSKRVLFDINCYENINKHDDNDIPKGTIFILPILPWDIV